MPYSNRQPSRYTKTNNIGKIKNTGILFTILQEQGYYSSAAYFSDSSTFLSTSTAGFSQSGFDLSNRVVSNYEADNSYLALAQRPYLDAQTRPFFTGGAGNTRIDIPFTADLLTDDTIRIAFVSNYASASVSLTLASDTAYTNTISYSLTGTATNTGTVAQPKFESVFILKRVNGTLAGTPDLAKIIRARFLSINTTAVNRVAPVLLQNVNNVDQLSGAVVNISTCCTENFVDKLITETDKIECGTSTIGETITEQSIAAEFETMEEDPRMMAFMGGAVATVQTMEAWKHLDGFEVGQLINKIVADVVATPTRGQVQLAPNLNIYDVVIGCASLTEVPFNSTIPTAVDTNLNGGGYYSYDRATGLMYFNTTLIGKTPEIKVSDDPIVLAVTPRVGELPRLMKVIVQDIDTNGKRRITKIKKLQFKFPERAIEKTGHKLSFKATGYFSKTGDIQYGYEI